MKNYIIRLDDAAEYRNKQKWDRVEDILDKYHIKPLVGVIPDCQDELLMAEGKHDDLWNKVSGWQKKNWTVAMHGCTHKYRDIKNDIAEFGNISLNEAETLIEKAWGIFLSHEISPKVFFAPAHQFNDNTVRAIKEKTDIRIISDGYAKKPYYDDGITYVPAQTGKVKIMPYFAFITFVYHPNMMKEDEFQRLEIFLKRNKDYFIEFPTKETNHKKNFVDIGVEGILKLSRKARKGKS